jgi:hypothetical protein
MSKVSSRADNPVSFLGRVEAVVHTSMGKLIVHASFGAEGGQQGVAGGSDTVGKIE